MTKEIKLTREEAIEIYVDLKLALDMDSHKKNAEHFHKSHLEYLINKMYEAIYNLNDEERYVIS